MISFSHLERKRVHHDSHPRSRNSLVRELVAGIFRETRALLRLGRNSGLVKKPYRRPLTRSTLRKISRARGFQAASLRETPFFVYVTVVFNHHFAMKVGEAKTVEQETAQLKAAVFLINTREAFANSVLRSSLPGRIATFPNILRMKPAKSGRPDEGRDNKRARKVRRNYKREVACRSVRGKFIDIHSAESSS